MIRLGRLNVDDADYAILDDQRYGELRPHIRNCRNVTRIGRDISDQDRLTALRSGACNPFAYLDTNTFSGFKRMPETEAEVKLLRLFVQQQYAENFVINDSAHEFRDAVKRGVEVEGRVDDIGDLEQ